LIGILVDNGRDGYFKSLAVAPLDLDSRSVIFCPLTPPGPAFGGTSIAGKVHPWDFNSALAFAKGGSALERPHQHTVSGILKKGSHERRDADAQV
jgi:hypothetical protein